MLLKRKAGQIAMVSLTIPCLVWGLLQAQGFAAINSTRIPSAEGDAFLKPTQPIASLNANPATNGAVVHVRGTVIDLRPGEYIVINDETGTLFADMHQAATPKLKELVDVVGTPYWDGSRFRLKDASFQVAGMPESAASAEAGAPAPRPAELPVLTRAWQVRDLTPEQAAWRYPVKLRAVVTYFVRNKRLCVQDDISGIYVNANGKAADLKIGDLVEIEGASDPGQYAPILIASNVAVLGQAPLPEPRQATVYQLASSQEGSQWVEVQGVVQSVSYSATNGEAQLLLNDPTGRMPVVIPADSPPTHLLDAIIRARGITASTFNSRRQFAGPKLLSPSLDFVQIEEPGVADPLSLPVRPVISLNQFRPRLTLERRVNIAGTVTLCQPQQWFFLQDTNDGIQVFTSQTDGIQPGSRVRAAGYPATGSYGSVLRDAVCRVEGQGEVPKAERLVEGKPLNPQLHGRWTQADVQLLECRQSGSNELLKVQFGNRIIEASCLNSSGTGRRIPAGSVVRLTGVYTVLADETRAALSFQLLVPGPENLLVLQQPSWWKSEHLVPLVGTMTGYRIMTTLAAALAVVGVIIMLWAVLLRRKVHQQTASLREQMTQQVALEQRFRDIFDGATDLIFTHDLEGRLTSLNPEAQRVLGYDGEESALLLVDQIFAPENRSLTRELFGQKQGSVAGCECELVAKDGRRIPVEISAKVVLKDGRPHGVQAIARSIADRKQIELALRDSEARYRRLVELSPIAMYVQCEGQVAFINAAALELLGALRSEDVLNQPVLDFIHPDFHGMESQRMATMRDTGVAVPLTDQKYLRLDGGEVDVETTAAPFMFGDKHAAQVILHDISERKRTEDDLFRSQQTLRTVMDTIPQRVFWKDRHSVFLGCNKAYAQDCGHESPGDMVGKSDYETAPSAMAEASRADDQLVMESGQPRLNYEEPRTALDGSLRWLRSTKVPLYDKDGQVIGVLGTYEDITDRKQADAALAEASNLLDTMLVNTPDYVYFKDRESRFVRYSHKFLRILQLTDPNALKGKSDFDIFTEEHARPAYEDEQRIIQTGEPLLDKLERETHKDGHVSWAITTKLPWRDQDGNIIGTFGISKDVTAMKQAEERLAETSSLLETLLANSPDCIYFKDGQSRFVRFSRSFAALFNIANPEELQGKSDFDFFTDEHARPAFEDEQAIIRTGKPIVGKLEKETHPDGRVTWALTTKMPWRDQDGNIIGTFGISKDVTSIKEVETKLAYERELFRTLLDTNPDSIYFKDLQSRFVRISKSKVVRNMKALANKFRAAHPDEPLPAYLTDASECSRYLEGKSDADLCPPEAAREFFEEEQRIIQTGQAMTDKIGSLPLPDGKTAWFLTTKMPWRDEQGEIIGTLGISRNITALKEAEAKLENAHQRLIETSRLAGMAEVATDVLHNVGNVLNSVNVSCSLTMDRVKTSKMASLAKVSALLTENKGRLGEFFGGDPRGQQIPDYLAALAEHLTGEQKLLLKELEQLLKHIDHIKQIVAMQQSYAKVAGVLEAISPSQLVEDALHINAAALTRHDVQVCREIADTPQILTEKHKVLQILVNLIRNAKYALDDAKRTDKLMTLKVQPVEDGQIQIQVIDNGVGIPAENLTRIFSHGFTTRRNGHGFGLHSSALAIKELGGRLLAHSDGPGLGAVFTLILPKTPPDKSEKTA